MKMVPLLCAEMLVRINSSPTAIFGKYNFKGIFNRVSLSLEEAPISEKMIMENIKSIEKGSNLF